MKPVQYTDANKTLIDEFNTLPDNEKLGDYWSLEKISPVRKQIKDHYIAEQKQLCCYCKKDLHTANNGVWDGEHIMSRSVYAKFMFEPLNLATSCKDCNIAKGEKEVLKTPGRKTFPTTSKDYIIVHPHFDNYEAHIIWIKNLCKPRSQKGINTIHTCQLLRYSLSKIGAEDHVEDAIFYNTIGILLDPSSTAIEKRMANAAMAEYLAAAKETSDKIVQSLPGINS